MTRFVIDAPTAIRLAREGLTPAAGHRLVAPALLHAETRGGGLDRAEGRRLLEALAGQRIRLLGDRVSRATAWRIAEEQDWEDTAPAEYVAVTRLQADALVALDPRLRELADGLVPLAGFEELLGD